MNGSTSKLANTICNKVLGTPRIIWIGIILIVLSSVGIDLDHIFFGGRYWHEEAIWVVIFLLLCGVALTIASACRQVYRERLKNKK